MPDAPAPTPRQSVSISPALPPTPRPKAYDVEAGIAPVGSGRGPADDAHLLRRRRPARPLHRRPGRRRAGRRVDVRALRPRPRHEDDPPVAEAVRLSREG